MDRRVGIALLAALLLSGCYCKVDKDDKFDDASDYWHGCFEGEKLKTDKPGVAPAAKPAVIAAPVKADKTETLDAN